MLTYGLVMLGSLLCSLQLSTGSFPKPLTEEQEQHYLSLAAQGDLEARNVLIERNLRLVAHIMKKYYSQTSDQEDLISIGTIGLIKGITTFDQSKGARLATYAARCVENAILTPMRQRHDSKKRRRRPSKCCGSALPLFYGGWGLRLQMLSTRACFWRAGQVRAWICCAAASAWTRAALLERSAFPAWVAGFRTRTVTAG